MSKPVCVTIPRHPTYHGQPTRRHAVRSISGRSLNYDAGPEDYCWQAVCGKRGIGNVEEASASDVTCPKCAGALMMPDHA